MMISKHQLFGGVAEFITQDVISGVTDIPLKLVLGAIAYRLRNAPDTFDVVLDNLAVKTILAIDENEEFNLDATLNSIQSAMQSYGNLSVTVPAIPLISKLEKTMTFTPQDIERLRQRILDGGNY